MSSILKISKMYINLNNIYLMKLIKYIFNLNKKYLHNL